MFASKIIEFFSPPISFFPLHQMEAYTVRKYVYIYAEKNGRLGYQKCNMLAVFQILWDGIVYFI